MVRFRFAIALIVVCAPLTAFAQATEVYIPNYGDGDVSVLDPETLATLARIPIGTPGFPEAVAFSPDGRYAFISIGGSSNVAVIDTAARAVVKLIPVHAKGDPLIFARPGGDRIYVTDCGLATAVVDVIDVAAQAPIDADPSTPAVDGIPLGPTFPMAFSPDGTLGYIGRCGFSPTGIHVVDLSTNVAIDFIETSELVNGLEVAPAGDVGLATGGSRVLVIDMGSRAEVGPVLCGGSPCSFSSTQGVEFGANGARAYVADFGSSELVALDMASPFSPVFLYRTPVAAPARSWELEIDGDRAYVIAYDSPSSVVTLDISVSPAVVVNTAAVGNLAFEIGLRPPDVLTVTIDIRPGTLPNSINLGSNGIVPVAILSSADFDATTVDPVTVTLAAANVRLRGNGVPATTIQDVNGDGLLDMTIQVETAALELSASDTAATLVGRTTDGTAFRGTDSVRIVGQ